MESTCLPHFPRPSTFDGLSRRSLVEPDARRYECEACGRLAAGRGQVRCEKGKAPPAGVQFRLAGPPLARRVPGGCLTRRCARKVGRAGKRNLNPARPLRGEQPSHGAFLSRSLQQGNPLVALGFASLLQEAVDDFIREQAATVLAAMDSDQWK
jgi:hypothetical protein